jgi:hypothetical protein
MIYADKIYRLAYLNTLQLEAAAKRAGEDPGLILKANLVGMTTEGEFYYSVTKSDGQPGSERESKMLVKMDDVGDIFATFKTIQ